MRANIFMIIFSIIDVFSVYLLYHAFVQKRVAFRSYRIILPILCGTLQGILGLFVTKGIVVLIIFIVSFIILYRVSKLQLSVAFILFVLLMILFYSLQLLTLVFTFLPINDFYTMGMFAESFFILLILFIYWKIPIWKLFRLAAQSIIMKFLFFIISTGFFISFIIFNFSAHNLSPFFFHYLCAALLSGIGVFQTAIIIRKYTSEIPAQYHEQDNLIAGLVAIYMAYGNEELRESVSSYLENFGKKDFAQKLAVDLDSNDSFLESFLKFKQAKASKKEVNIIADIAYEENNRVSQSDTVKIIGILLDNAIEHCTNGQDVYIEILIAEYHFDVTVKNPYSTAFENTHLMFKKGYSSKKEGPGGHGLPHLRDIVDRLNGEIMVQPLGKTITFKVII